MNFLLSKNEAYKKYEFKKLCHIIGFKQSEIVSLLHKINSNYKEWSEKKTDKKSRKVKTYLDGTEKTRTFRNPSQLLKTVQSRIKNNILSGIELPKTVHGGVKKRSNVTNAKPHQGNKYIFTTDLQEFYPSINSKRVYDAFIRLKFSTHFSHWLTTLTTKENELPQGAPTSTHISNLVFLEIDIKLIELCNQNGITYTRYIDDLTFSSPQDFSHKIEDILKIITSSKFKISQRKTKYNGSQTVTGINIFLNKIDAPVNIIEKSKIEIESESKIKPYTNYRNNILKTNRRKKA
ncbi:MAG: RNA-directed DNA polymerase [Bacteroidales bacterium]|nr:RNA-directed DNA polymerase [Bacteroidales bacterium]